MNLCKKEPNSYYDDDELANVYRYHMRHALEISEELYTRGYAMRFNPHNEVSFTKNGKDL